MKKFKNTQQIITHFSDQDLYSWSVCLYYLEYYRNLIVRYEFVDRNNTVYTQEFVDELQRQIDGMNGLKMTAWEINGLKKRTEKYFPKDFYTFLEGLEMRSCEVKIKLDKNGHLHIIIKGYAWRTVFWEQLILATVSELWHIWNGDTEVYDLESEIEYNREKAIDCIRKGVRLCDMGTRRRFSKAHHEQVLRDFCAVEVENNPDNPGKNFFGTSNLYFAILLEEEFPWLKCIGTMSHQVISVEAAHSGPRRANYEVMKKWRKLYKSYLGCYLPDCLGTDIFYQNMSLEFAKAWDSYRIDSGKNEDEFEKLYGYLKGLNSKFVDPTKIGCVFSNGLHIGRKNGGVWVNEDAQLKHYVNGRMDVTFGNGTTLTCGLASMNYKIRPCSIVIKLTGCYDEDGYLIEAVKLSCDPSKATGDPDTVSAYQTILQRKLDKEAC